MLISGKKYLREFIVHDADLSLTFPFENPSIDASRKVEMFTFHALKHAEELWAS